MMRREGEKRVILVQMFHLFYPILWIQDTVFIKLFHQLPKCTINRQTVRDKHLIILHHVTTCPQLQNMTNVTQLSFEGIKYDSLFHEMDQ